MIGSCAESGGKALYVRQALSLITTFNGADGIYQLEAGYFDTSGGKSRYDLSVNGTSVARWTADDRGSIEREDKRLNGSTRHAIGRTELR